MTYKKIPDYTGCSHSYLIITSSAFNFALALGIVQDGAWWTEAAFAHGCTADGAEFGNIRRIFERR